MFKRISAALGILLKGVPEQKPPKPTAIADPLDPLSALNRRKSRGGSVEDGEFRMRSAFEDIVKDERMMARKYAYDAAVVTKEFVGDQSNKLPAGGQFGIPEALQNWYISQSFIGWQACAILAQQWLVNKACSQSGEDAVRHGWEVNITKQNDDGFTKDPDALGTGLGASTRELDGGDPEILDRIKEIDTDFGVKEHCSNLSKFTNIFGIRVCIYVVDYDDPKAYEKPFNIDAVKKGKYKGIRQVDPYWTAPMLDSESASDPTSLHFYIPTWWVIGGRRYHYSHLHISLGPEVSDILKPQYYYGGVPLTQRIYERVYAAERTANEAPLLSMSKRTTALHVDLKKVAASQRAFEERLSNWVAYRDNHAVKVLGLEETMEESDTSLADFDSVIMNQYQLVAAIAETPSTKLLGTSPKGFSSTGEFEEKSYHEKLESIQSHCYDPFLSRHYELLCKSEGWDCRIEVAWNPTDAKTAEQLADINLKKAQTGQALIEGGTISPDEERQRIRTDKNSGYGHLSNTEASAEFVDPEPDPEPGALPPQDGGGLDLTGATEDGGNFGPGSEPGSFVSSPEPGPHDSSELVQVVSDILSKLKAKAGSEGSGKKGPTRPSVQRSAKPGVVATVKSELRGDVSERNEANLPKRPWGGYTLAIENPAGSFRSGVREDGKSWSSQMAHDYGYFAGTVGADGDGLDVFVGKSTDASHVYIVNQNNPSTGAFDEHKVFVGFDCIEDAENAYHGAYTRDWQGFDSIHPVLSSTFREWLSQGDLTQPFSYDWRIKGQTANSHEPIIE